MQPALAKCLRLLANRTLHTDANCTAAFRQSTDFIKRLHNATIHKEVFAIDRDVPTQMDVWNYLEIHMGQRRDDLATVIIITIVYSILLLTGVFGNICTCIVIARNKFMHTATNYYLFNLAIADLFLLIIGLPPDLVSIWSLYPWVFGEGFCIFRALFAEVSTFTSILTISAFTVERYVAICHPMKAQKMSSLHRAVRVIVSTWIVATICAIPQAVQYGVVYIKDELNVTVEESAMCTLTLKTEIQWTFVVSTVIFFVLPMTFISILYTMIAIAIRRSTQSGGSVDRKEHLRGLELHAQQQARARRSVIKMLVAVVVAFFVCWAPFHAERMMTIYVSSWSGVLLGIHKKIFYLSGICYFINGTINPILYSIMSLKFRQAFKQTLRKCCRKTPRHRRSHFSYKFVHRNGHTETSYTSVGPMVHGGRTAATTASGRSRLQKAVKSGDSKPHSSESSSNQKRESITRSISGSSLKSTDEMCQEEDIQQVLFQIKCYDSNRNTAELLIGVC